MSNGGTAVTGIGTNWTGANARQGDDIVMGGLAAIVDEIVDATHLTITDPWPNDAVAGSTYKIVQRSPLRFAGGQAMADVSTLIAALNTEGFYIFVPSTATEPDPSLGDDGQYARQPATKKEWHKEGGVWIFDGTYTGIDPTGPWDNATAYHNGSVAEDGGSSYMALRDNTNKAPASNPDDWMLLASKGDIGATGSAATIAVGTVTDVAHGQPATVTNVGTAGAAVFDFEIPAGQDGTGTGDVVGPSSSTDSAVAGFSGTTGKLVKELTAAQVRTAAGATTVGAAVLTATDAAAARNAIGVRETLTADRTYYVRVDGSDSNDGLTNSSGGAFLTIQKAVDTVASLDCGIFNATVQVGNGTYTQPVALKWVFGSGAYTLQGDTTTPANVVISTTSASCFSASGHPTPWNLKGFKMQTTTSGQCIQSTNGAFINVTGNVEFGACAGYHMFCSAATLGISSNYRITGGAACHINCINSGIMTFGGGSTTTGVGTLAFSQFAFVNRGAGVVHFGGTFSGGTYTGTRYLVASVGYIDTNGGGANYFPGNAAGSTSGGGQYV